MALCGFLWLWRWLVCFYCVAVSVAQATQYGISRVYKVDRVKVIFAVLGWTSKNPNHYAAS
jgi:hypothetical protein